MPSTRASGPTASNPPGAGLRGSGGDAPWTVAEAAAAAVLVLVAAAIVFAYLIDSAGLVIAPFAVLALALVASAAVFLWLVREAKREWPEFIAFASVVAAVLAWLLSRAWPAMLPAGTGSDLTHHLVLIDHIEHYWRLVHDSRIAERMGDMANYTPGSHLLAALAGRWSGTDGLQAFYPVVAAAVALKVGIVFLILLRILPRDTPRISLAVGGVLLLLLPRAYLVGSFTHDSFFAQVVAETFAVAMWWLLAVWADSRSTAPLALFAAAGAALFLTWPIWVGPLMLTLILVVAFQHDLTARQRLLRLLVSAGPIACIAALYVVPRLSWLRLAGTSGAVLRPSVPEFGWAFILLSSAGLALAARSRRGRPVAWLVLSLTAQGAALYAMSRARGAATPYMAYKMAYLVIYPLAAAATLTLELGWRLLVRASRSARPAPLLTEARLRTAFAAAVVILAIVVGRELFAEPRPRPVVSLNLASAGRFARDHLPVECVDYVVADGETAYWLHLAVLRNPWSSARTASPQTFAPRQAIARWIEPEGLPFAVADLTILPNEIVARVDELARFGSAVVIRRRGPAQCDASR
jgi:hypothetical protein